MTIKRLPTISTYPQRKELKRIQERDAKVLRVVLFVALGIAAITTALLVSSCAPAASDICQPGVTFIAIDPQNVDAYLGDKLIASGLTLDRIMRTCGK